MFPAVRLIAATVAIALLAACAVAQQPDTEQGQTALENSDQGLVENAPPAAVTRPRRTRAAEPAERDQTQQEGGTEDAGPDQHGEPETEQSQEPEQVEPLSQTELLQRAVELSPDNTVVVRERSAPMAVFHDVQRDGYADVAVVTVEGLPAEEAKLGTLSNMRRLFTSDVTIPGYYIEVYAQTKDGVSPLHTFYLGKKTVFSGFAKTAISQERPLPVALSALFYSSNGQERNWATFAEGGQVSLFIIQDTPTVENAVLDIDGDGLLDVVEYRTSFEEGRGYETFVTWYRWSGTSYARHMTTNIVRNLNAFLAGVAEELENRQWGTAVEKALTDTQLEAVGADVPAEEVIRRLLKPLRTEAGMDKPAHSFLTDSTAVTDVVLPDILENPFPDVGETTSFTAPLRIVCCDGSVQYYSVQVVMQQNPFSRHQFYLQLQSN